MILEQEFEHASGDNHPSGRTVWQSNRIRVLEKGNSKRLLCLVNTLSQG